MELQSLVENAGVVQASSAKTVDPTVNDAAKVQQAS